MKRKHKGYWTKERCHEKSLKYESRRKFEYGSQSAYNSARKNGWLDEICSHMKELKHKNGYWTKERCHNESLKYNHRNKFQINSLSAYDSARKNGWLDEICSHMKEIIKPRNYWTKEKCHTKALNFNTKSSFREKYSGAYNSARRNGWLDEICLHMNKQKYKQKRCVYIISLSEKHIYIGLTYNLKNRFKQHLRVGNIHNFIINNNIDINKIKIKKLTNYIDENIAKEEEQKYIKQYKKMKFILLNNSKGGELGSNNIKWSLENCLEIALNYDYLNDFRKNHENIYSVIVKNGWMKEFIFLKKINKPRNYWTKEKCYEESLKYKNKTEFSKKSSSAYSKSIKNGWIKCFYV